MTLPMIRQRLKSGVLLGAALLGAVFFLDGWAVLLVNLFIVLLAMMEFYSLLDARQIPHFKMVGTVGGLLLVAGTWWAHESAVPWRAQAEQFLLYGIVGGVFIRQIARRSPERPWDTMAGTLLGVLYVAFLFNFIVKLLMGWGGAVEGRLLVLYLAVVVKCTDIGAYLVGCNFGRHKLIPRISPGKTWEGVSGGVLTGLLASLLCWVFLRSRLGPLDMRLVDALVLGLILPIAGVVGDLIESLLKRAAGVKDSGRMFLGMGGILDVIDSLLFSAPLLYIYARIFMTTAP